MVQARSRLMHHQRAEEFQMQTKNGDMKIPRPKVQIYFQQLSILTFRFTSYYLLYILFLKVEQSGAYKNDGYN